MIPILWRYVLKQYTQVFGLTLGGFVGLLIAARLDEIAHFASLGPHVWYLLTFILFQIPYILPIAVPIASLIASWQVSKMLSEHREANALRALGISPMRILAPVLFVAFLLALGNFYCVSEMATHSHYRTQRLKHELRTINPLLLLHHKHLMRLKGITFETFGPAKMGEYAQDAIIAMPDHKRHRMQLMVAKNLVTEGNELRGEHLTFLSNDGRIFVENLAQATSPLDGYTPFIQNKTWKITDDQLQFGPLLTRLSEGGNPTIWAEICRRLSLALAVFSLSFLGGIFGFSLSRMQVKSHLFTV
ncbi:MAG: LptF/LptG family permease, partial [Chlamydiia bacterium]|nr:LptF/LptG family permease [Chlamydiia bacterium]